jgi:hypothetical protein
MNAQESLPIIESLRSGISSRTVSRFLSQGREKILDSVNKDLQSIKGSGKSTGRIIRGEYGEGKTHLLYQVLGIALEHQFVVSLLPLSKETPFHRIQTVYGKVMASTYLPGNLLPGFEKSISRIRPDSPECTDLFRFTEKNVHPKLHYILLNYFHASDPFRQYQLYNDLTGSFVSLKELRLFTRDHRIRPPIKLTRFRNEDVWDYLRFIGYFFRRVGYSGWVILFDEAELIGKLGPLSRGRAYAHMARFLNLDNQNVLLNTYTIFALAGSFYGDILFGREEPKIIPEKLIAKGRHEEAEKARQTLRYIAEESLDLVSLEEHDVRVILEKVVHFHGTAYSWHPHIDLEQILLSTKGNRLRTRIRYTIETLDLAYLYPAEKARTEIKELEEARLNEDDQFFTPASHDERSNHE